MKLLYKWQLTFLVMDCIEPIHRSVLGIYISKERNMVVADNFSHSLVDKYRRHTLYPYGGT